MSLDFSLLKIGVYISFLRSFRGSGYGDAHGDGDSDLWVPEDDIYQAVALPIHLLGIDA